MPIQLTTGFFQQPPIRNRQPVSSRFDSQPKHGLSINLKLSIKPSLRMGAELGQTSPRESEINARRS